MTTMSLDDLDHIDEAVGAIYDADAHEMAPIHFWGDVFGPSAGRMAELLADLAPQLGPDQIWSPDLTADDAEITHESVWHVRGNRAPSAFDLSRRVEVLDVMGVERQLLFSTFAIFASLMCSGDEDFLRNKWGMDLPIAEIRRLGQGGIDDYNAWAERLAAAAPDRLRPVGYVLADGGVTELLDRTQDLVSRGIRVINLPAGNPPAGVSPADPALDPFWEFVTSRDIPVVLHLGGDRGFMASGAWAHAPAFAPGRVDSVEIGIEPYSFATVQFSPSNYLTALTLGGVFERFPDLRIGAIELGCTWLGPLAENLDMWAGKVFAKRLAPFISMRPSEYLARNVRVTPYNTVEPIERELERYPYLRDCYCYSSDYPHFEGGTDVKRDYYERIAPLGPDVVEGFFRRNAELLLPD